MADLFDAGIPSGAQHVVLHVRPHTDMVELQNQVADLTAQLDRARADQYRLIADLSRYHTALDDIRYLCKLLDKAGIAYKISSR